MGDGDHLLNIERAVLSAIIFSPELFEEVASKLDAQDFYLPFHAHLYEAMGQLDKEELPIDETFLQKRLLANKQFNEQSMIEVVTTNPITDIDAYVGQIKAGATKRSLAQLASEIRKYTIEEDLPADEVMNLVEKKLYDITQNNTGDDFRYSGEIIQGALEDIERIKALGNSKLLGVDTGFMNLNDRTSGFGKGDLVIIAARPAMGKTALVLNMALKALERNEAVAFFSLEMPAEQLMLRMLSMKTSIP